MVVRLWLFYALRVIYIDEWVLTIEGLISVLGLFLTCIGIGYAIGNHIVADSELKAKLGVLLKSFYTGFGIKPRSFDSNRIENMEWLKTRRIGNIFITTKYGNNIDTIYKICYFMD